MVTDKLPVKKFNQIKETALISWRTARLIWHIDKWLFIGVVITSQVPAVLPFVDIYIYKLIIDEVAAVLAGSQFDPARIYPLIGFRIASYFLTDISFRSQDLIDRILWGKVPIYISEQMFKKLSELDVKYFEDSKFRDLIEKSRETYAHRPQRLIDGLKFAAQSLVRVLIAFVALANLNWFLIILVLLIAIPEFINQAQLSKVGWGLWTENVPLMKKYHYIQHLLTHFREIKEIKLLQLASKFMKEAKELQFKIYNENMMLAKRNYKFNTLFNGLSTAVFIGVEVFVILEVLAKRMTLGDINFYTGIVSNFQNGLGGLFRNINEIFDSSLYVKSLYEVLDIEPTIKSPQNPVTLKFNGAPRIEFINVGFAYPGEKKKILNNFSLVINPGEKVAFVGENGAGKSTIIKLLVRFYDVNDGQVLINGTNIKDLSLGEWYKNVGVLFQDFNRYEARVKENIQYGKGPESVSIKEVIEASISAGSHPMVQKLDKKYMQVLGRMFEGGVELSGGEWQRIALARAFLRSAPVLVLDEPTASIDAKAEAEVFNKVERLSKEKTVIIISHRFSTVRNADKIYVIDNGGIVESGSHQQLIQLDGKYAQLFNLQAKGYK